MCLVVVQIIHDLGLPYDTPSSAETCALELLSLYKHSLTLCRRLDPKEKAPGDDLIPMAVAALMAARNLDAAGSSGSNSGGPGGDSQQQRLVQRRILQVFLRRLVHNLDKQQTVGIVGLVATDCGKDKSSWVGLHEQLAPCAAHLTSTYDTSPGGVLLLPISKSC